MENSQYTSAPKVPPGVSIEANIQEVRAYAESHSRVEVYKWFYEDDAV